MSDFLKNYGRLALAALVFGTVLELDNLFTGPLAFVTGVSAELLNQCELAIFIFILTMAVARLVKREFVQGFMARRSGGEMPKIVGDISGAFVIFIGIAVIMGLVFKRDITALLATGGASLMIIGIALRDLLLAAFTGILLNIEKPFKPGDLIKVNDKFVGYVEQITWRATVLQTLRNERLVIPNLMLASATILNHAQPDARSTRAIEVVIDYDTSVESAERILYAAVLGAEDVKMAVPPAVNARAMERFGVVYEVSFTIANYNDYKKAEHAVIKSILKCMRDAGVTVSFPKTEWIQSDRRVQIADRSLDSLHLVQQCHLFRDLPDEVCQHIAGALVPHHFAKGSIIVQAGERRASMFIVGEGMAKRTEANRDGSALIDRRFIATQSFGRKSLLARQPQAATVVAETNVLLYELSNVAFGRLMRENPGLLPVLVGTLAKLNWHEIHGHSSIQEPDPVVIARLVKLYRGQIEACYALDDTQPVLAVAA
jgi:hypothetical protein